MFGISWKIVAIQAGLLLLLSAAGYWYWNWSQSRIASLLQQNAQLETAVSTQEETITVLRNSAAAQARAIESLQSNLNDAENTRRAVEARLRRMNLQLMARNNAAELESTINRTVAQAFSDLETVTRNNSSSAVSTGPAAPAASSPAEVNQPPPPRPPVREQRP